MTVSYLDNSATTPICPAAKQKMTEVMEIFGNPSSLHSLGMEAEKTVTEARDKIFTALGAKKRARSNRKCSCSRLPARKPTTLLL